MTGSVETMCRTTTRVRYPETDRMGVAHHTHYLVWFELGRTELMRGLDCTYGEVEERDGFFFPVVELGTAFKSPARYDEVLEVQTQLVSVRAARVRFEYKLLRQEDGKLLATGYTVHGIVGSNGRPGRMPQSLRGRLEMACTGNTNLENDDR